MHAAEVRRYLEGRRQLVEDKKHSREQQRSGSSPTTSPNVTSRKQEIKAGQQAERNRILEEINDDFSG